MIQPGDLVATSNMGMWAALDISRRQFLTTTTYISSRWRDSLGIVVAIVDLQRQSGTRAFYSVFPEAVGWHKGQNVDLVLAPDNVSP